MEIERAEKILASVLFATGFYHSFVGYADLLEAGRANTHATQLEAGGSPDAQVWREVGAQEKQEAGRNLTYASGYFFLGALAARRPPRPW